MTKLKDDLPTRFDYHAPSDERAMLHSMVRQQCNMLAGYIVDNCPECRETSLAITKLEEALMWANAALARRS